MKNLDQSGNNDFNEINNVENIIAKRNTDLDSHLSNIGYYIELLNTKAMIKSFTTSLLRQMAILCVGGHRKIMDITDDEEANEYIFEKIIKQKNADPMIFDLYDIYNQIMLIYTGFATIIDKNRVIHDFELEKLYDIMEIY